MKWLVLLEKLLSVKLNMSVDKRFPFLLQVICGNGIPDAAHVKDKLEPTIGVELVGDVINSVFPIKYINNLHNILFQMFGTISHSECSV